MKKGKKNNQSNPIFIGIILLILGIIFTVMAVKEYLGISGNLINLNNAKLEDLKAGDYVELDIEYSFGSFCENVQTTNYVFKKTTDQYYLINTMEGDSYFAGVKIADSKKDDLENLTSYTYYETDVNPGPLHYKGKLVKTDSEVNGYLKDYLHDMLNYYAGEDGLSATDISKVDSYILPYYISVMNPKSSLISVAIGSVFALLGLIFIIVGIVIKKKAANAPEPAIPTPYGANSPYADPSNITSPYNAGVSDTFSPGAYDTGSTTAQNQQPYVDPFYNNQSEDSSSNY